MPAHKRKINPTIRHILESPCLYKTVQRLDLSLTPEILTIDHDDLATILGSWSNQDAMFFTDTCFLNGPELPDAIWDPILASRLVISPYIWREIGEWVEDPYRNKRAAAAIRTATRGDANGVILDHLVEIDQDMRDGREYYVTLLGYRKSRVRDLMQNFEMQRGRKPDDTELTRLFNQNSQPKDYQLLRKGKEDIERCSHFFSDEDLIVTAGIAAISDGSHTVILTRDKDVLEQFSKFVRLITPQYSAMLFAEKFAAEQAAFVRHPLPVGVPTIECYFDTAETFLVQKPVDNPDQFMGWVLPREYQQVRFSCILLGGNHPELKFSMISFNAERDMQRLMQTKGKTFGLNTDRLNGRNCHVTGYPIGIPDPRKYVVIGRDKLRALEGGGGIPLLDIGHTVNDFTILSETVLSG